MAPELVEELSLSDPETFLAGTVWWVPEARSEAYEQVWNEVLNA
jgi:hypothetical protein